MYRDVKLEKGMYHLANKSFMDALEEADPTSQYAGTGLADLDAYGRQLKRFDIHVSGPFCDRVEKFFASTESAVLFPEFVRRAVMQGMEEAVLSSMTAVVSHCESNRYQGCNLEDSAAYTTTSAGRQLPVSSIMECDNVVTLSKYGRAVNASYEAVRQQRLDVFALMLRRIGKKLADSIVGAALNELKTTGRSMTAQGHSISYGDLAVLYGSFNSFRMKTVLASPKVTAEIMVMEQMKKTASDTPGEVRLPFGSRLVSCPGLADNCVIGLDNTYALEQIQSSDVVLETDKLIDRQLDCIGISVNIAFRTLMADAIGILNIL